MNVETDATTAVRAVSRVKVPLDCPAPRFIDAVRLRRGDTVLLTSQMRAADNGVYVVPRRRWWQRRLPLLRVGVQPGGVQVGQGAAYADTRWIQHQVDGETRWTRFAEGPGEHG